MITQKNLNVVTQFGTVPIMQADQRLLRMVLQNLVSNALKYTPDKGTITVEIGADEQGFGIRVADNGYGIPKDQQAKIFSKLYRAENVKQKNVEGTGLGLYIIKAVVDQSGGKVWFESEEDKGTTFYVTFPKEGMRSKKGDKKLNE